MYIGRMVDFTAWVMNALQLEMDGIVVHWRWQTTKKKKNIYIQYYTVLMYTVYFFMLVPLSRVVCQFRFPVRCRAFRFSICLLRQMLFALSIPQCAWKHGQILTSEPPLHSEECSSIFDELNTDALPLTAMIFPERKGALDCLRRLARIGILG